MIAKDKVVGNIRVYRTIANAIGIMDDFSMYTQNGPDIISFDECMAEKICKYILEVAKEIREYQNENK